MNQVQFIISAKISAKEWIGDAGRVSGGGDPLKALPSERRRTPPRKDGHQMPLITPCHIADKQLWSMCQVFENERWGAWHGLRVIKYRMDIWIATTI